MTVEISKRTQPNKEGGSLGQRERKIWSAEANTLFCLKWGKREERKKNPSVHLNIRAEKEKWLPEGKRHGGGPRTSKYREWEKFGGGGQPDKKEGKWRERNMELDLKKAGKQSRRRITSKRR